MQYLLNAACVLYPDGQAPRSLLLSWRRRLACRRYQMMPYAFETNVPPIFAAPGGAEAVAYGYVRARVNATHLRYEVRSCMSMHCGRRG